MNTSDQIFSHLDAKIKAEVISILENEKAIFADQAKKTAEQVWEENFEKEKDGRIKSLEDQANKDLEARHQDHLLWQERKKQKRLDREKEQIAKMSPEEKANLDLEIKKQQDETKEANLYIKPYQIYESGHTHYIYFKGALLVSDFYGGVVRYEVTRARLNKTEMRVQIWARNVDDEQIVAHQRKSTPSHIKARLEALIAKI